LLVEALSFDEMFELLVTVLIKVSCDYLVQTVCITFDEVDLGELNTFVDEVIHKFYDQNYVLCKVNTASCIVVLTVYV
jgi:hypothetical protein